ncbi:MAG: raffinose/stachyose/melibiose transport system substrate-binding protein [Solirubrobacteraceae bacterium]|nr:raffinose/stachyose/melibiose transport system substrate-binding protein [Solirubrobacteraceae bacterium]
MSSETGEGPKRAIQEMSKAFQAKYPNVTVKVSYRDFSSWIKQVKLTLASKSPPDVVAGNQGYQVDGELVKAGLIMPLDKYAKAYGWEKSFSPLALQQFKWSQDGRTFGEGTIWGIAQSGQSTGVFADKAKLQQAGVDPAALKTFADFDAALAKIKASLPADEPVIMLGNKEQYEALHLWGMLQGAYTPAQDVRDWIFHRQGKTFDSDGNRKALAKLKEWNDKGYLGRGDDYNGRGEQDAANLFARGKGAFMLAGNWNAQTILDGLKDNAMFFNMPPGDTGKVAAIGSASVPIHISSKSKNPDLAAAYIDFIAGRPAGSELVKTTQVPAVVDATAQPSSQFGREIAQAWQQLVDDGGLTLFHDWSSPTMLETIGQSFQELLAGRASVDQVVKRVQKDWSDYDSELRSQ